MSREPDLGPAIVKPRFITLEGGEGTGKSTQARLLADALEARGLTVLRTREPGGTPGAEHLRNLLLDGAIGWSAAAETLLHFAARAEHVERAIRPSLDAGEWVVCDRFFDSTMAYQGYGLGADRGQIATLSGWLGLGPDLTLVLDAEPAVARGRLLRRAGAADRYESMDWAFHARIRAGFLAIAAANPQRCALIDANDAIDTVHATIVHMIESRLPTPA